jgi:hypothetical protein
VWRKYAREREVKNQTPLPLDPVGNKFQYSINEKLFGYQKGEKSFVSAWNRTPNGTDCRIVTLRTEVQKCKIKYLLKI